MQQTTNSVAEPTKVEHMRTLKRCLVVGRKSSLSVGFVVAALLTLSTGCSYSTPDQRLAILEEQAKMLMILEAQQGFGALFKTAFDPGNAQVLLGADLRKWFQDNRRPLESVPEPIRTAIRNNQGAALLIRDGLPGRYGGKQDVVYLRPSRFGFNRFFVKAQPDPCGDGNPATCEFCSGGCSGETSPGGTISSGCYCTESCDDCRPCPKC